MARHVHTTSSMTAMHENYVWQPWTLLLGVPKLEHTMDLPSYDHLHSTLLLFMPKLEMHIWSHWALLLWMPKLENIKASRNKSLLLPVLL